MPLRPADTAWDSPVMGNFTDIHCHIVPSIDDGAADLATALAMARQAVEDGTSTVIATPHQLGGNHHITADAIRGGVSTLKRELETAGIPLTVLPGADVRIEPELPALLKNGTVVTLADRGRHVLLELPHDIYVPIEPLLQALNKQGLTGILSHPERNRGLMAAPQIIESLVARGCLMQITAGSLLGGFGSTAKRIATNCVQKRLVHFVASDAHDTVRRPFGLATAFAAISALADESLAMTVCRDNPARAAAGDPVVANSAPRRRFSFFRSRRVGAFSP
jgi:protein-tyrosine phosphatase